MRLDVSQPPPEAVFLEPNNETEERMAQATLDFFIEMVKAEKQRHETENANVEAYMVQVRADIDRNIAKWLTNIKYIVPPTDPSLPKKEPEKWPAEWYIADEISKALYGDVYNQRLNDVQRMNRGPSMATFHQHLVKRT